MVSIYFNPNLPILPTLPPPTITAKPLLIIQVLRGYLQMIFENCNHAIYNIALSELSIHIVNTEWLIKCAISLCFVLWSMPYIWYMLCILIPSITINISLFLANSLPESIWTLRKITVLQMKATPFQFSFSLKSYSFQFFMLVWERN